MLEKENLTPFQIQLLLYYLTAEPSKRTVTDSARSLNVSKWVVTRTLDTLEKLNIVERLENRKTVLTVPGVKLAEKYQKQRKVLEKYIVPFPVSWTVKMKKKQKETQDILSYHTQAAGCSDKARAKASGGRQPIEECGRTGL